MRLSFSYSERLTQPAGAGAAGVVALASSRQGRGQPCSAGILPAGVGQGRIVALASRRQGWGNRRLLLALALAPLLAWFALGFAPVARADGGAPNLAYVSGAQGGIAIIDIASQKVSARISLSGDPRGMVLSADSRFLYVALAGKNGVGVIDANTKQETIIYPTGLAPTSLTLDLVDPSHLWVANTGGNTVTVLNPDSGKELATIAVGQQPMSVAIAGPATGIPETDGSSEVIVANHNDKSLTMIGSESFKVITTISLPEAPLWVTVPGLGGTAYIATDQGHLYGLTLATHQLFGPIFSGQQFRFMDYDATSGNIYVPDSAANVVNVLHPVNSGSQIPTKLPAQPARPPYQLSGAPWSIAVTSDGSLGLVGQHDSGDVTILDVPGHSVLSKVHVGGAPQFVLAGPYPPLVNRQTSQVLLIVIYVVAGLLLIGGIAWLVLWIRKQERRIRALQVQEDAEYERQLLASVADIKPELKEPGDHAREDQPRPDQPPGDSERRPKSGRQRRT